MVTAFEIDDYLKSVLADENFFITALDTYAHEQPEVIRFLAESEELFSGSKMFGLLSASGIITTSVFRHFRGNSSFIRKKHLTERLVFNKNLISKTMEDSLATTDSLMTTLAECHSEANLLTIYIQMRCGLELQSTSDSFDETTIIQLLYIKTVLDCLHLNNKKKFFKETASEKNFFSEKEKSYLLNIVNISKLQKTYFEHRLQRSRSSKPINKHDLAKISRNSPCPCGSGKKFKKCCG